MPYYDMEQKLREFNEQGAHVHVTPPSAATQARCACDAVVPGLTSAEINCRHRWWVPSRICGVRAAL